MTTAHKSRSADCLTSKYFCRSTPTTGNILTFDSSEVDAIDTVLFSGRVGGQKFWTSDSHMKLSVLLVSTYPFNFIGVIAVNKSVNDAATPTELEWRVAEVPERHTSFRSRYECYVSVRVGVVTLRGGCSTKNCQSKTEIFWVYSRVLAWSNAMLRSKITFSRNRCPILMDRSSLMKASLIASPLCSSVLTAL